MKVEREELKSSMEAMVLIWKMGGVSCAACEIVDSPSGEMNIVVGGDGKSAIVSKAALHMKKVAPDLDGGVESTTNIDPFALIKVGKKWKFDGVNDLITDILPAS